MWLKIKVSWHDVPFLLSLCFPPQIPSHNCIYFAEYILFLNYYFLSLRGKTSISFCCGSLLRDTFHSSVHFTAAAHVRRVYSTGGGPLNAVCLEVNSVSGGAGRLRFSANDGQIRRTHPPLRPPLSTILWMCTPPPPPPPPCKKNQRDEL